MLCVLIRIASMSTCNLPLFYKRVKRLIVLGFNDTSILVGHFVLSPREREKEIEEIVEEIKERNREERGTGMKGKKKKK